MGEERIDNGHGVIVVRHTSEPEPEAERPEAERPEAERPEAERPEAEPEAKSKTRTRRAS
ncbi:MAG: hypothetical protein ACRD0W_16690 [Acidimicrobiales bacterium]